MLSKPQLLPIIIAGPTAIGKTSVAIALANRIHGEILNADSMQIYRHLDIGTAKPTTSERAYARFHLIDIAEPDVQFTVADWKRLAEDIIEDCGTRGVRPIVSGGTGFYIRALLQGWTMAASPSNPEIRDKLNSEGKSLGSHELHCRLTLVDQETAERLHPNDVHRIIRALEVFEISGVPLSEWQRQDKAKRVLLPNRYFCMRMARPELLTRIERRVRQMRESGFTQEVKDLLEKGLDSNSPSMRSLGYKEICQYLSGEFDENEAYNLIVRNTQQYSRRQMTWFRSENNVEWLDVDGQSTDMIADRILALL